MSAYGLPAEDRLNSVGDSARALHAAGLGSVHFSERYATNIILHSLDATTVTPLACAVAQSVRAR